MNRPDDLSAGLSSHSDSDLEKMVLEKLNLVSEKQTLLTPIQQEIRDRIEFRLMGYSIHGQPTDWREDVQQIRNIESTLVINPVKLKEEFASIRNFRAELEKKIGRSDKDKLKQQIREYSANMASFSQFGGHTSLNSEETLFRVRREGLVIHAGIAGAHNAFHTIGYNYGLTSMPEDDEEFLFQSKSTIQAHEADKGEMNAEQIYFNWRTGIAKNIDADVLKSAGINVPETESVISLRRMGIASALKFVLANIASFQRKEAIYFNIGDLLDVHSSERIRNAPSFYHNTNYFKDARGYRNINSDVVERGELGVRNKAAKVRWKVHGDEVDDALDNLLAESSVLRTRQWNVDDLRKVAVRIYEQKDAESKKDQ